MREALAGMISAGLERRNFSTGSKGFHAFGRIVLDGISYQAQAQAILVGSKGDPELVPEASTEEIGTALVDLASRALTPKDFRSGRSGFLANGKVTVRGQRYQANVQAVRLT
ncbi:hypothetical protein [Actinomadura oligospora]|uniref:hypothetical protein n=1 Tax=Actinomadura oligospora TaxID=111804 RepID=UPI0012FC04F2|nr:hypothetical protein [Actinomadura oligospora]